MKRWASLIVIQICLVSLLLAGSAGAAISPASFGSFWTEGDNILHIQVWDYYLNGYVYHTYQTNAIHIQISNVNMSNGIVRWIETHTGSSTPFSQFHHCLYDPMNIVKWKFGHSYDFDDILGYHEADGVVTGRGNYTWMNQLYNGSYFSTYDPVIGEWVGMNSIEIGYGHTPGPIVNQDGIVAFRMGYWPNDVSTTYFIYDYQEYQPERGWRGGVFPGDCDSLSVESFSVKIVVGGSTYYRGYNPNTMAWQDGLSFTKSYFMAGPTLGRQSLWVWFWDLSLGALNKLWDFGDGTPTNGTPSYYHFYTKPGTYKAQQIVTGNFYDATSTTIKVMGTGIPGLPLLLLD